MQSGGLIQRYFNFNEEKHFVRDDKLILSLNGGRLSFLNLVYIKT